MPEKTFHSLTLPGQPTARVPLTAVEFNTGTTYAIRDYCTYQGKLYRCIAAHAAGAWNAAHFTETNIDNELDGKLMVPPYQASAPSNPRVGDLWVDSDENSPVYNVDSQPVAGSTNAVQSGGTFNAIKSVDDRKGNRSLFSGDYSVSATYEVNQLVMNGQQMYRCTTGIATPEAWNVAHWTATNLNTELDRLRTSEADMDMIAENYGDSNSYAVGDYVVHNSDLFRCISEVSDTGSWDPDDWSQVRIADDVADLKSVTDSLIETIGEDVIETELIGTYVTGYYWNRNSNPVAKEAYSSYTAFDPISVEAGKVYKAHIWAGTSSKTRAIVFVDSEYTKLSECASVDTAGVIDVEMEAPVGSAYALLTCGVKTSSVLGAITFKEVNRQLTPVKERLDALTPWEYLQGKTVAVIGDSISTNGDSGSNPNAVEITVQEADVGVSLSAYLTYYDVDAGLSLGGHTFTSDEIGNEVTFTPTSEDVGKKIGLPNNYYGASTKVWWEIVEDELGCQVIPVCWSGASITSHEGGKSAFKTSYAWHEAQLRKCGLRTPGTMTRTAPDVVIIYRGTNDFSHTPYTRLTSDYFNSVEWEYPVDDFENDVYGYKEGLCLTIKKLRETYPNAKIVLCTLNVFKRINYSHFPTNNGINTLPQYNNAIREVADFMGCGVIEFDKDGITFENCYSQGYITDSQTIPTHPSAKGHMVMALKAIADLKAHFCPMGETV